ncbi:MAG: T9SS type A sorting domain-containing protein, partial [Bacteroidota bacterium]
VSAPIHATVDYLGRVYASDFPLGQVWRMDSNTAVPKRIVSGLVEPKGLAVIGTGTNLKLYIAAGGLVLRANIGTSDTLTTPLDTIANLGGSVRDVIFDDQGFMYVNNRSGTGFEGTAGGVTERFDITGTLPVTEFDALWIVQWTGFPIGLGHWSGSNLASADDDIIYVSQRSATTTDPPGVFRITQITGIFPQKEHLFRPSDVPGGGGGDISSRADLTVDPTGNVVLFENGNEEIIFLEPPSSQPTVSYTTKSAVTFPLGTSSVELVDPKRVPLGFELKQNYPNPFNPSTTMSFVIGHSSFASLRVFDILGREIATLVNEELGAGNYNVTFDARNLPGGTYFYTLKSGEFAQTKKLLILK